MQYIACSSTIPITPHAQIGLRFVARKPFEFTQTRTVFTDNSRRFRCHTLVGTGFDELSDPEAARVPSRKLGRQGVIRADNFVTIGNIGFGPKK